MRTITQAEIDVTVAKYDAKSEHRESDEVIVDFSVAQDLRKKFSSNLRLINSLSAKEPVFLLFSVGAISCLFLCLTSSCLNTSSSVISFLGRTYFSRVATSGQLNRNIGMVL